MNILENIITNTRWHSDAEKRNRVMAASRDFSVFCKEYLPHIFTQPFCTYHKDIIQVVSQKKAGARYVMAAPREHGKTQVLYTGLNLWLSLFGYEDYIVNLAASHDMAVKQFRNIKTELESNEKILSDFGDVSSDNWKKTK
ncbi:MAG: hypothetical protein OMM_15008 [Candidatus Magnetoglobus multicellularis str. Araruama]|uniref:Terminase large subunit gp17-like C-terminal domain-containing protein n=1 Tax=Candidatus Magnetoglobus multicellularis str. Araruama TaxID=890399 RepID=A0A1V1NQZ9_9BACT|nr:MAG: hypothetical protein OMM_15008 [Candidatus Magnetoglobus multicellularis str. Araruama]